MKKQENIIRDNYCLKISDMDFINASGYTNSIDGWMSDIDLKWLHLTAQSMDNIIEIGSWKGKSTDALLSGCKGVVWAIDHFLGNKGIRYALHREAWLKDIGEVFIHNVGHYSNLKLLKLNSLEAVKQFKDKSIDMVFIDGGHSYNEVKNDIQAWLPKTRKIICGHDYSGTGVKRVVQELLGTIDQIDEIWAKSISIKE